MGDLYTLAYAFPLLSVASLAVQAFFAVHAVRTGRTNWLWLIVFFPVIGSLVYFFTEYWPSVRGGGRLRTVQAGVMRRINPEGEIRKWEDQVAHVPSLVNRMELARAYARAGRRREALEILVAAAQGHYATDPVLLWELCRTYHEDGQLAEARDAYERLGKVTQPSKEQQLVSARIREDEGDHEGALREYASLARQSAGDEARIRYALLLRRLGRDDEGMAIFHDVLRHARISSRVYRQAQKPWIDIARAEIKRREPAAR